MELSTLLIFLAVLACPIGMGLMMWLMNKNMADRQDHAMPGDQKPAERLATLRAQRKQLEAEIAETARIAELEARREALLADQGQTPDPAGTSVAQRTD